VAPRPATVTKLVISQTTGQYAGAGFEIKNSLFLSSAFERKKEFEREN
jgi:hypothetical protein